MGQHPVSKELFLTVLTKYGFAFEEINDGSMRFSRGADPVERHFISDPVARAIVMRFAHKYRIPRVEFWPASLRAVIPEEP
jgi:hypothetical protein